MMKAIVKYDKSARNSIEITSKQADRISYPCLKQNTGILLTKLKNMKFQNPTVDPK